MSPYVDFIVPVASESAYIDECVSSIRCSINSSNNIDACRIIIAANGLKSSQFKKHLDNLAFEQDATCIHFKNRLQIYDNWNRCLRIGNSPYINFVHDDDLLDEKYVSHLFDTLSGKSLVLSNYSYFNDGDFGNFTSGWSTRGPTLVTREQQMAFFLNSFFHMSAACFRRSDIKFDARLRFSSDQDFIRRIALDSDIKEVAFLDESSVVYIRSHPNQDQRQDRIDLYAAMNLCTSNSRLIKRSFERGIDAKAFGRELAVYPKGSARVLSSYNLDWPLDGTIFTLMSFIRSSKNSFTRLSEILLRIALQRVIWFYKLHGRA